VQESEKGQQKQAPRQIFGCGCPIYARYEIRDLVTGSVLERFNGSLQGITTREAAEEYLDSRFSNVRSGQIRANTKALTVAETIERFIAEKKSSMPPPAKVQVSERVERAHQRFGRDPNDREREIIVKHRASLGLLQSFTRQDIAALNTDRQREASWQ
jgi:hypothetical protein